ncbi:unnamed protein product [Cyclocybe aegerita]|uniref:Phospholipase/carboxylesterase/thioesterase domain-containing protein n=1 Tax=Cyclocybe aegerita TaxID=1973307 RepID=A0A8S0XZP5_CYCAE|nr:unnamed protein product [Cyclocybe aegerita]
MPESLMAEFHLRQSTSSLLPRVKQPPKASKISGQFFYAASDDGIDENLLILLHGLGDTHVPFSKLGKSLKLPQTAVLALRAPEQVPFLYEDAYQWYTSFDDLGEIIDRPNPTPAFQFLNTVVDHLTNDCAWPLNRIHFFGFAQGGSVAAEFAIERWKAQFQPKKVITSGQEDEDPDQANSFKSFASIVTISGPLLSYPTLSTLCPTPTLVAYRSAPSETALPTNALSPVKKAFQSVTESKMRAKSAGMPSSKEEWEPIMRFWSQHLSRRQVDGLYEAMTGASASTKYSDPAVLGTP